MPTLYTATTDNVTYALLVNEELGLVSQVYPLQVNSQPHTTWSDMMALHTKQTQLLSNQNYWLWPIDPATNQFPTETHQHTR